VTNSFIAVFNVQVSSGRVAMSGYMRETRNLNVLVFDLKTKLPILSGFTDLCTLQPEIVFKLDKYRIILFNGQKMISAKFWI
jgi:hypothetical protein